jgi:hypothetical protein
MGISIVLAFVVKILKMITPALHIEEISRLIQENFTNSLVWSVIFKTGVTPVA